jgi:hypothetical protein
MVTLAQNFTKEQKQLADRLLDELIDESHHLEEFSSVHVYGLVERGTGTSILFEVSYSDPDEDGNMTIYDCY